jgi:hypothetical protein
VATKGDETLFFCVPPLIAPTEYDEDRVTREPPSTVFDPPHPIFAGSAALEGLLLRLSDA